jgi:hypothetical protein
MARPGIQRDIDAVLDKAGLGSLKGDVRRILAEGLVTETTAPRGTLMEWMAMRRGGQPDISRNLRWDGALPLEGYEFTVSDALQTYTFFVPETCGNLALIRRELKPPQTPLRTTELLPPPETPQVAQVPTPPEPPRVETPQRANLCGSITGSARSTAGRALARTKMELLDAGGRTIRTAVTAGDGSFSVDPAGCGTYVMRCVADNGRVLGTSSVSVNSESPTVSVTCATEAPFWTRRSVLAALGAGAGAIGAAAVISTGPEASPAR